MKMYEITVGSFPPVYKSALTPAKARASVWRDYNDAIECSFKDFLSISKVKRCENPDNNGYAYVQRAYGVVVEIGQRVRLINEGCYSGKEGEIVYPGTSTAHIHVKLDEHPHTSIVHPMSIEIIPARAHLAEGGSAQ